MKITPEAVEDFDFHGEALDNIFDAYDLMLEKAPVGHSSKYGGFTYIAKSEDIFAAEQAPDTFSVAPSMMMPSMGTDTPLIPIDIDPPAHTQFRNILLPLFTPMNIAKLEPGMRETGRSLAADVVAAAEANGGVADVSKLFARPMPTIVFSRLAGYPEEDWKLFDDWIDDIIYRRTAEPEVSKEAGKRLMEYFDRMLTQRKEEGGEYNDLLDKVINLTVDGRSLTHDEQLSYSYLLFLAGLDTTAWGIRASLWYLARNPEAQQKLREHPEKIPAAVEEFLRTLSPVQAMARTALKDTVVQGQEIKKGERVVLVFGAGNRDPEVFENPETIDIEREDNRHLAFGAGIHRCLGSNLARKEMVIGLEEFLKAIPSFEIANPEEKWHGVEALSLRIGKA